MTARTVWRWILAAALGPGAAMTAHGCAIVGGISPPGSLVTCNDGKMNGDESDVDCGGSCGACNKAACAMDAECASGICYTNVCTSPTNPMACPPNVQGDRCQACHSCGTSAACVIDTDCASGLCKGNVCVTCDPVDNKCTAGTCFNNTKCPSTTCMNGVKDADEDGVDCGGNCSKPCAGSTCGPAGCGVGCKEPCGEGTSCAVDADCLVKHCDTVGGGTATCQVLEHCLDGMQDGGETDVDCGGPECVGCGASKLCVVGSDCVTGTCTAGACSTPAHCGDHVVGDGETDVDCGDECAPCADSLTCNADADCLSNDCEAQTCARCRDKMKDLDETDVDCGGALCPSCGNGSACKVNADCLNHACVGFKCADPSCTDGVEDGKETGVDCGGSSPCGLCDGDPCSQAMPGACRSGYCGPGNVCASSCSDGAQDGSETDVDCGGDCPPCAVFDRCKMDADCAPGHCTHGICRDATCGPTECAPVDMVCGFCSGNVCTQDSECQSGKCDTAPVPHTCM